MMSRWERTPSIICGPQSKVKTEPPNCRSGREFDKLDVIKISPNGPLKNYKRYFFVSLGSMLNGASGRMFKPGFLIRCPGFQPWSPSRGVGQ